MFRLDRLIAPVFRVLVPYMVTVGLLAAACFIETNARQYEPLTKPLALSNMGNLAVNLVVHVVAIIAMRSIGLFYGHYACYFSY